MSQIAVGRIRFSLKKLEDPRTKQSDRFRCWRLIISAAQDAHEFECRRLDSLNSVVADPAITSLTGSPVV